MRHEPRRALAEAGGVAVGEVQLEPVACGREALDGQHAVAEQRLGQDRVVPLAVAAGVFVAGVVEADVGRRAQERVVEARQQVVADLAGRPRAASFCRCRWR
jgi:hypothetical protein